MINKDKEVGGTHYADMKIEPIELIQALKLDFFQGSIVKYVSRYKNKNGIEDLKKASHYCQWCIDHDMCYNLDIDDSQSLMIDMYCDINNLADLENIIIESAVCCDYVRCLDEINNLMKR